MSKAGPRGALIVAATAIAIAIVPTLSSATRVPAASLHLGTGLATNYDFAHLVLSDGGWPASADNVTVLTQWLRAEEPPTHWWNRDNPLNNGLGSGGGDGTGSYGSVVTAAYEIAANLHTSSYGYPLISRDLASSASPATTAAAIWRSSWAAGHYARGADWATTPVISVPAPPGAWRSPRQCPTTYPHGVVGPCGIGFSSTGATWHPGAPAGLEGQAQWAFSSGAASTATARWALSPGRGSYAVAAFIPTLFSDATVTYVVTDAKGSHRVIVDQEPYSNAWALLGTFVADRSSGISVVLRTSSMDPAGSTYVAADAMQFTRTAAPSGLAPAPAGIKPRLDEEPGAPLAVSAVAGDSTATVSWLPPSKDGGSPVARYIVASTPGGHRCAGAARPLGEGTCVVTGLSDGTSYTFVVRAANRQGLSLGSTPSIPAIPLMASTLGLSVPPRVLQYEDRVLVRATTTPRGSGGTVLFVLDGRVIRHCQDVPVRSGAASCEVRLSDVARHVLLATYTGDSVLAGTEGDLTVVVLRARPAFRAAAAPVVLSPGGTVALRAWHLPGRATGSVTFFVGHNRLCTALVRTGAASCVAEVPALPGVHLVVGRFTGDRDYLASAARTSIQVLPVTQI